MRQRGNLSRNVYGLDNDIIQRLFQLPSYEVERFCTLYEKQFGAKEASYARAAWTEWKYKRRGISGLNAGRFIDLAPKFFSFNDRYEIVSKLYEKTRRRETHSLTAILGVNEGAFQDIENLFARFCQKPSEHEWPENLVRFANWLCDEDSQSAKLLIAAIDRERSEQIIRAARVECDRVVRALKNLDFAFAGTHRIELPYGTISLYIRKPNLFEKIKKFFA